MPSLETQDMSTTAAFLAALPSLRGKVVAVTGGAANIGLHTTLHLLRLDATVYVLARNLPRARAALDAALVTYASTLPTDASTRLHLHELDLGSVRSAAAGAGALREKLDRLDVLIANAAIINPRLEVNEDGVETTFATNVVGNYVLVRVLLDLLTRTAKTQHPTRLILVNSDAHTHPAAQHPISYPSLTPSLPTPPPPESLRGMYAAYERYCVSKLGLMYLTLHLARTLRGTGVRVAACHPGSVATGLGGGTGWVVGRVVEWCIKGVMRLVANTPEDAAKTGVWLAAVERGEEGGEEGEAEYWVPRWGWTNRFIGVKREEVNVLARDRDEEEKLWRFCEGVVERAGVRL